mmetsp:Transcript_375/g.425  ORF Transcript_375/g.425 Transcript_375/m.425 type:complete len:546 (+) Transcript_375:177-1814(+)
MFKAVVFDLGGVVLGSPLEGIAEYEAANGIPDGFINVAIVEQGRNGAFQRLERGEIDKMQTFYEQFKAEIEKSECVEAYKAFLKKKNKTTLGHFGPVLIDPVKLFDRMMEKAARVKDDMLHAIFILRGLGYKVVAVTNNWKLDDGKDSSSTHRLQSFFDDIIESAVVGVRKPDARMYQLATDRLGVRPEEIVFLDDIGTNLKAASAFGWSTIKVDIGQTHAALAKLEGILNLEPKTLVYQPDSKTPITVKFPVGAEGGLIVADMFGLAVNHIVVLLHGGGQTRHSWKSTAIQLKRNGYCVLTVDSKGHGDSYWDTRREIPKFMRYNAKMLSEDLDRLILHTRLHIHPKGFSLIGASLGGLTILHSEMAKDAARAIVLVDITPKLEVDGVKRILKFMTETSRKGFDTLQQAAESIALYNPKSAVKGAANLEGLKKNLRRKSDGRWYWHWDPDSISDLAMGQAQLDQYERDLLEHASKTATPCLLAYGQETDVVSWQGAENFLRVMPQAECVVINKASHMVVGDENDSFASEGLKFLDKVLLDRSKI